MNEERSKGKDIGIGREGLMPSVPVSFNSTEDESVQGRRRKEKKEGKIKKKKKTKKEEREEKVEDNMQ